MKTVGTKLDNSECEIFEFCCNENGLTKSEQLRDLIKNFVNNKKTNDIEQKPTELPSNPSRPEIKNVRISIDNGKTWYKNGKVV